jgi:hypothetical protein
MAHPRGRQPIGVNQPPSGGTNYPFVRPSDDIEWLLGDFYLSFPDDRCAFAYPFHIAWLYGFGTDPAPPENIVGWPTPVNAYDLVIQDDNGNTVFDSTTAEQFATTDWPATNPRLKIIEWVAGETVCRCTLHTQWTQHDIDAGLSKTYEDYIVPANGELDSRTLNKLPLRVRSIRTGLTKFTGTPVVFEAGFNIDWREVNLEEEIGEFQLDLDDLGIEIDPEDRDVISGDRVTERVTIEAIPGAGLGVVPGCQETEPILRKFAGATADAGGNILLDMEGCLWGQRPVGLTEVKPREFRYLNENLTPANAAAGIEIGNDCGPCCECSYFVRTYAGLKRQWNLWQDLAIRAEDVRDTLNENIDRWLKEKDCREQNPLKLILLAEPECKAAVGALYCNTNKCCAKPLIMRFTFQYFVGENEVTPPAFVCDAAEIDGSPQKQQDIPKDHGEEYALAGQWPVYEALFEYANPQDTSRVSFRVCIPECAPGTSLKVWVSVHYPDMEPVPETGEECDPGVVDVPDNIAAIWAASVNGPPAYPTRALKATKTIPLNNQSAFCETCECPTTDESVSDSQ